MNEFTKWKTCPCCAQLIFITDAPLKHRCPEKILKQNDEFLTEQVEMETVNFDKEFELFRNDKQTKFYEWLVENDRV